MGDDKKVTVSDVLGNDAVGQALNQLSHTLEPSIYDSDNAIRNKALGSGLLAGVATGFAAGGPAGALAGTAVAGLKYIFGRRKAARDKKVAKSDKRDRLLDLSRKYEKAVEDREKLLHSAGLSSQLANLGKVGLGVKMLEAYSSLGNSALREQAAGRKSASEDVAEQLVFETERQIKEITDVIDVLDKEKTRQELEFVFKDEFFKEKGDL